MFNMVHDDFQCLRTRRVVELKKLKVSLSRR